MAFGISMTKELIRKKFSSLTKPPTKLSKLYFSKVKIMTTNQDNQFLSNNSDSAKKIVGYFVQWGVYQRNYHVNNIKTSGSINSLTHINYAFGNVTNNRAVLVDTYADYDRFYKAEESVDGVADTWDNGALRGSFNQLRKLKAQYPHIKVLISLGGWTLSTGFPSAARPENRVEFVKSCIDLFIKGNFSATLSYPGIFDGIDIDWEYPGPEDTQNFTDLMAEFRKQLDAVKPGLLLTGAFPAGDDKFSKIQLGNVHQYMDFINLMTYDFHGAWESTTNFNSPLYGSPANPSPYKNYNSDYAIQAYLNAGVPANKLLMGVPFYGRGWTNVPNVNNGLYQSGVTAPGTIEQGVDDYKVLAAKGYPSFRHPEAQAYWIFDGSTFWSYDDPTSMTNKMNYINSKQLGGAMFWELSGDSANGELIGAIKNTLQGSTVKTTQVVESSAQ